MQNQLFGDIIFTIFSLTWMFWPLVIAIIVGGISFLILGITFSSIFLIKGY